MGVLTRKDVLLLNRDTLRSPGALDRVVILLTVRPQRSSKDEVVGRTSLFEMGTESWTMLPMTLTLALRSFSFSAAEASRSFFSFSIAAGAYQHAEQSH